MKHPHPGKILQNNYLVPNGLSGRQVCRDIGTTHARINEIVRGTRNISASTALRLAKYFGTTAEYWMDLQRDYDLEKTYSIEGEEIQEVVKPLKSQTN